MNYRWRLIGGILILGILVFGTVGWAATTTTCTLPGDVYRPAEFVVSSTTTNSVTAYDHVKFIITVDGPEDFTGDRANTFTVTKVHGSEYMQGINDTFMLVNGDWVGYWRPVEGFELIDPYDKTTPMTIQMCDTGTAPLGDYDVTVALVDLDNSSAVLATATGSFTLSADTLYVGAGKQFTTIQDAIDAASANDTISVATGTYNEAILIDGTDLTIQAASTPVLTGIADSEYIIKVANAVVTLDGLTVNGTGNNIRNGIWYFDASGVVNNCTVQGLERANLGTAVRIQNSAVNITDNLLKEFWRNGIFVRDAGSGGTTISGNEIICHSIDDVDAAYHGIEIGWGAKDITIRGNTIYDSVIATIGLGDWNWTSQGIVVWGTRVTPILISTANILDNTVHHVMEGIHVGFQPLDGDTSYALIRGNHVYDCLRNIVVVSDANADIDDNTIEMLDPDVIAYAAGSSKGIWVGGTDSDFIEEPTADITNNSINNCDLGIDLYENAAITVTGNTIANCDYGIKTNSSGSEAWAQTVTANFNNISDNTPYGIDNLANTVASFDATNNWWGDASGPYHATLNPSGLGNAASDSVDFDPWTGMSTVNVVVDPDVIAGDPPVENPDAGVSVTIHSGTGSTAVTIAEYSSPPPDTPSFGAGATYVDVQLSDPGAVTELTITFEGMAAGTVIYFYLPGTGWIACSHQVQVGGTITVTVTDSTVPTLAQLIGTVFAGGTALGNINGDGVIDVLDVRLCLQIASGFIEGTGAQQAAADVDQDGDVDRDDAQILAEYIIGIRLSLPGGGSV